MKEAKNEKQIAMNEMSAEREKKTQFGWKITLEELKKMRAAEKCTHLKEAKKNDFDKRTLLMPVLY